MKINKCLAVGEMASALVLYFFPFIKVICLVYRDTITVEWPSKGKKKTSAWQINVFQVVFFSARTQLLVQSSGSKETEGRCKGKTLSSLWIFIQILLSLSIL